MSPLLILAGVTATFGVNIALSHFVGFRPGGPVGRPRTGSASLLVVASLVLPYLMVFHAEFGGREKRVASDGATQRPLTETLLAYVVAGGHRHEHRGPSAENVIVEITVGDVTRELNLDLVAKGDTESATVVD